MIKSTFRSLTTFGLLGLGLAAGSVAQAQSMGSSKVEGILKGMMEQPISLFLGLPIAYDRLWATDLDGTNTRFEVTLVGANLLGQGLGDLSLQARVSGESRLDLNLDLREVIEGLAAENQTVATADTLRIDATIDTDRGAYERVRVVVDNLFAANARNQEEDFFKLDGAIFSYDERRENQRVAIDFGLDGFSFNERGVEQLYMETIGASFELVNHPDWLLHTEANNAFQRFVMAQAGMIPPTFAAADVLESIAPLFEVDLIDLGSSIEVGKIVMNDLDVDSYDADLVFDGMLIESFFDAAAGEDRSRGSIGGLTLDAELSWDDEAEPFRLISFEGAALDSQSLYNEGYDLKPLGGILRAVAADIRALNEDDLRDPEAVFAQMYLRHSGTLLDWAVSVIKASYFDFTTGKFELTVEDEWEPVSLKMDGSAVSSVLEINGDTDRQSFAAGLSGLVLKGPDDLSFEAGEFGVNYALNDSLVVIRDVLVGLQEGTMSMGDAIRFGLSIYLPDLALYARDMSVSIESPLDDGPVSVGLAALDFSLTTKDMDTDNATLALALAQDGLAVGLSDEMLHPGLIELLVGNEEPGVLPSKVAMQVDLADIPMEMLLSIADNVTLPPIETMMQPDFDPTTLALAGMALISPLLSSPPAVVVQPSEISGGMVQATAEGRVEISPLTEPNRAVGSVTVRVTGMDDLNVRAAQLMAELAGDESDAGYMSRDILQGLMGVAVMAGGFGIPTDDGALEFIIDVPVGAPANINGLPIPLDF